MTDPQVQDREWRKAKSQHIKICNRKTINLLAASDTLHIIATTLLKGADTLIFKATTKLRAADTLSWPLQGSQVLIF
jgi:hypothetical protein